MTRSLALIAALAFGMSSGAAWAGGGDWGSLQGSLQVSISSSTVASADGQSAPSTQIQLPRPKGG